MLFHEDLDVRFNAYIPFLELEFSSKFSNYCFKDRLLFVSYLPNDVTNQADTQEVCQHTKDRDKNKAASDAQWRSLSSTTNNFTIKFHSSAEMNREGAVVEWWTDNMQKSDRPDHCKYLSELPTPSQDSIDTKYGRMSDYYHMVYIGFIFILSILFAYWLVKKIYSCCFGLEKTNSGVISDSEDDDDWDDQYDPDEPDDDVDDFSLLTLLEMKANREELETAVNDLRSSVHKRFFHHGYLD